MAEPRRLKPTGTSNPVAPPDQRTVQHPPDTAIAGDWVMLAESLLSTDQPIRGPEIPGYEILGELGRGGMGIVYKARHQKLDRVVALKVILTGQYANMIERVRFRKEAEAIARLQHPNIVQIFDIGEFEGTAFMAMEFVDGGTLQTWQSGKPQSPKTAGLIMGPLARAIQHAHENGVLHRDLKPANVLLARTDQIRSTPGGKPGGRFPYTPKITDFGLAKRMDGVGTSLTATGVTCGTPHYMPPEQVRKGDMPIGPPADVYALGGMLYELLSGRPPFAGYSPAEVLTLVMTTDAVSLRFFRPDLPDDLVLITEKCLEKDPARRYQTAEELADDLEAFSAGEPIKLKPAGRIERGKRWMARNPTPARIITSLAALAGGLGVCAAGATVWAVKQQDDVAEATAAVAATEAAKQAADAEWKAIGEQHAAARQAFHKGLKAFAGSRYNEAERELTSAVAGFGALETKYPGRVPGVVNDQAEALMARSLVHARQNHTRDAEKDREAALALDPSVAVRQSPR